MHPILVAKGDIDGDNHDDLVSVNGGSSFRGSTNENLRLRKERCVGDLDTNGSVGIDDLLGRVDTSQGSSECSEYRQDSAKWPTV